MKPCSFDYHRAESLEHAIELLSEHGDEAKVLAGGQSLVPAMNFRLAQPAVLIDINGLTDLANLSESGGTLRCGALTRQATVERSELMRSRVPLLAEAMPFIAHPQIRNRGTMGGSLAHADPSAELPAVAVALQATLIARGPDGERRIAADDFFVDLLATDLEPVEILTDVEFSAVGDDAGQQGWGFAFDEVARRSGDYALVGVATAVRCDQGRCASVRSVLLSVGPGPVLAEACSEVLAGQVPTKALIQEAARAAAACLSPDSDIQASAAFRRHLAKVLLARTLATSFARAGLAVL